MQKILLIVLDGFGIAKKSAGNAVAHARTPFLASLRKYPHAELHASGKYVGLPSGYMGNSEVGHLHMGAGRLIRQDMVRINDAIKDRSLFKNKVLGEAMTRETVHLLGLISDGGVHGDIGHLLALIDLAERRRVKNLFVHAITDGRDMPPKSCLPLLARVEKRLAVANAKLGTDWCIATVMGRYFAMDRDNRWNREHKAYDAMVNGVGREYNSVEVAVNDAYAKGESDEFIFPSIVGTGFVRDGDSVIFFNFRSDRARELTRAFTLGRFGGFKRRKIHRLLFVCMTQYDPKIPAPVAFPLEEVVDSLGEVLSDNGVRQFRLAETEKWAHVTFFFNGLSGRVFKGEDRLLIPSPKVTTYDKSPEMSAAEITRKACDVVRSGKYPFILINYANADMVGHTGDFKKTVEAVEMLDRCLATLVPLALRCDFTVLVTADHGNAEQKLYADGSRCTAHTTNKVPFFIIANEKVKVTRPKDPALYDVAPTILNLMGLKVPKAMTGRSFVPAKVL